ncbi:UNVERIFIED_CONTAM: hypothetical protein PYX00_004290 [Menopon gallinae]|uniref:Flap endonuclease GEN chromatin organization modifier domain-containing protein n=1 Tax=Menopon gallinae TaxID=328185 RepID=A0AAW2I3K7_9NEOP
MTELEVQGIGPELSIKYLTNFDGDILGRFRELKNDRDLELYETEKGSCKKCHHPGKQQEHTKQGCSVCGTGSACIRSDIPFSYESLSDIEKAKVDFELKIRSKIVTNPAFPDEATIAEYLNFSQEIPDLNLEWEEPNVAGFVAFMERKCNWCTCYGFEKIIPLYCRWALMNSKFTSFTPCRIVKKKVFKAVPCFDLEWSGNCLLYCDVHENTICGNSFTTVEPQTLVMNKCKEIYDEYLAELTEKEMAKKKARKKSTRKQPKKVTGSVDVDDLIKNVGQLSLKDAPSADHNRPEMDRDNDLNLDKENESLGDLKPITSEDISDISSILEDEVSFCDQSTYFDMSDILPGVQVSDYEIDESLIIDNIISRGRYH